MVHTEVVSHIKSELGEFYSDLSRVSHKLNHNKSIASNEACETGCIGAAPKKRVTQEQSRIG